MAKKIEVRLVDNPEFTNVWRFKIAFTGNPAINSLFNLDIKKNGSVLRNIDKTFTNSTSNTFNTIKNIVTSVTITNLLTNLQTFNTNGSITYALSPTVNSSGFYDIYINVTGLGTDTFTLHNYTNTTGGLVTITSVGLISQTTTEQFTYNLAIPSEFITATNYQFQFAPILTAGKITIGAVELDTIVNLYNFLANFWAPYYWATVTQVNDGVDIVLNKSDVTISTVSVSTNVTLNYVDVANIPFRDNIILSRSDSIYTDISNSVNLNEY